MMSKVFVMPSGNVLVPAYLALQQKGYTVQRIREGSDGEGELWEAENAFSRFLGEDPVMLLGLVALYETRGEDWKADDPKIDSFLSEYYPDD